MPSRNRLWAAALTLCVLGSYANCFYGVFHLDDTRSIERNESLRSLNAPLRFFRDPENVTRPVAALTFAIDRVIHGLQPAGYHTLNLAVHLIGSLLLFGVIRRTLLCEKLRARFATAAAQLAFATALIWAVHPLQTESVTYIVQRAESMMGMFFLLALYCVVRGAEPGARRFWHAGAIAAAVLGAGCKQVIVVLPFVVLLYDRCFISGSFKAALKRAPGLYAGLCLPLPIVALLLKLTPGVGSAGFGMGKIGALNYALSQCVVIVHYLRLAIWPANLCLDYAWNIERNAVRIVPCAAVLLALVFATVWQLCRNTAAGFCGAWFFLILAPTSSIMPIADLAVEHRMYLPLAALAAMAVIGFHEVIRNRIAGKSENSALKWTVASFALVGAALGTATFFRNQVYANKLGMLEDVLAKRPNNPRAVSLIALDAMQKGDAAKALVYIDRAVALRPNAPETHYMRGGILRAGNDFDGAIRAFETALAINPKFTDAWIGLSDAWLARDKNNAGIRRAALALQKEPGNAAAHLAMGGALANAGRFDDAIFEFNTVLKFEPGHEGTLFNRGRAYELSGREAEAIASYRAALNENPDRALIASALAWILATSPDAAVRNGPEALALAQRAAERTQNRNPLMLDTLAAAYAESGQFEKAAATAEKALEWAKNNANLAKEIQAHLALYKEGKPVREERK